MVTWRALVDLWYGMTLIDFLELSVFYVMHKFTIPVFQIFLPETFIMFSVC